MPRQTALSSELYNRIQACRLTPELPLAATYAIDMSGKIVCAFLGAGYVKRAEPEQMIEAAKQASVQLSVVSSPARTRTELKRCAGYLAIQPNCALRPNARLRRAELL